MDEVADSKAGKFWQASKRTTNLTYIMRGIYKDTLDGDIKGTGIITENLGLA